MADSASSPAATSSATSAVPSRPRQSAPVWQSNADAPNCNKCKSGFSLFVRRHHCRYCGKVSLPILSSSPPPSLDGGGHPPLNLLLAGGATPCHLPGAALLAPCAWFSALAGSFSSGVLCPLVLASVHWMRSPGHLRPHGCHEGATHPHRSSRSSARSAPPRHARSRSLTCQSL